ncbi:Ltp family lipoprotein [Lysobacter korlensis]|uniref:Ltp family lipoprotein n=1 Tax=Lysobacter korlensis TaxID=553636 RepID=A0ABV6RWG9_9GAMM
MSTENPVYKVGDVVNGHRLTQQADGSLAWLPVAAVPVEATTPVGAASRASTPSDPPGAPDYKVGDVANGHRLTQQSDGSLAWLPVEASAPAAAAAPAKKSKKGLWITLGAVGAVLLLLIVIGSLNRPRVDPAALQTPTPAASAEEAVEEEPVEEEPPAEVTVPDVTGIPAGDAIAQLEAAGFEVLAVDDMDATVTGTSPAAGETATEGSTVTLTVEEKPELTLGQQNAVGKAEQYLSFTDFSRTGLIEQLEFEGFSTEEATFAVDYLDPDWNAQAAGKAESYLEFTSFSRQGLIDQLVFDGFTPEQADFGADAVGY